MVRFARGCMLLFSQVRQSVISAAGLFYFSKQRDHSIMNRKERRAAEHTARKASRKAGFPDCPLRPRILSSIPPSSTLPKRSPSPLLLLLRNAKSPKLNSLPIAPTLAPPPVPKRKRAKLQILPQRGQDCAHRPDDFTAHRRCRRLPTPRPSLHRPSQTRNLRRRAPCPIPH